MIIYFSFFAVKKKGSQISELNHCTVQYAKSQVSELNRCTVRFAKSQVSALNYRSISIHVFTKLVCRPVH